jgi:hypothetical protein
MVLAVHAFESLESEVPGLESFASLNLRPETVEFAR